MGLETYHKKRRFSKTPEPKGTLHKRIGRRQGRKKLIFVVQKHDATRLHYDFRLEIEGVLKSWAVPKGPSLNPEDKRLAVHVEDHPWDYRTFEGVIPKGEYGGGNVIVWDEGWYEPIEDPKHPRPEGMDDEKYLLEQLNHGSLKFKMHGKKVQGEFALVQIKRDPKNWLLIKHKDEFASTKDITEEDESVKTGRTVDEVDESHVWKKGKDVKVKSFARSSSKRPEKDPMPKEVKPMLAELADTPFDDFNYVYEIKWDGYRAIAQIEERSIRLYSRNNQEFNDRFPVVMEELEAIHHNVVLDGEIVAMDRNGKASFQALQDYGQRKDKRLIYYVFDLLYLDGYDIRQLPLLERKRFLKQILPTSDVIKYSDHIAEEGIKLYAKAKKNGLEGVIAKRKDSAYVSKRTLDWLKIKNVQMQEAIVCGFTQPKGNREEFGALILGIYDNKELRYVGHTGGGFDTQKLRNLRKLLEPLLQKKSPFQVTPKTNTPATWVKPEVVVQVKFSEWTNEGMMRQPIYLGLREDKKPEEVTFEKVAEHPKVKMISQGGNGVQKGKALLTNLHKVYWPEEGYTKGDLLDYYERVSDYILPYLKDRPLSLNRHPNGINGESFFQKDLINKPDWVKTVPIYSESDKDDIHWLICNNLDTLLYTVNLGCIELNPWNARYQHKEKPDYMVLDLDPEGIPFKEVIRTAKWVKEILDSAEIDGFLKTSGKTGLHILIPLKAKYTHEQSKQFAEILANRVHVELPEITSVVRDPKKRQHKIYVDFLQNREGQTIAAPYCVRPVAKAPVSTPLEWDELTGDLHPSDFTIKTIVRRLSRRGDVLKGLLNHKGIDMLKSLKKLG